MHSDDLRAVTSCLAIERPAPRLLLISSRAEACSLTSADTGITSCRLRVLTGVERPDDVDMSLRADAGIVSDQLEAMAKQDAVGLLARLRDCHCSEILLLLNDSATEPAVADLAALGFIALAGESVPRLRHGKRIYRFRSGEFFQPRDWNTPENWAHPENFDRKRW